MSNGNNENQSAIDALVGGEQERRTPIDDGAGERNDLNRHATTLAEESDDRADQWWDRNNPDAADDPAGAPEPDIEALRAERDAYLADSQRLAADFANYRKQSEKRVTDTAAAQTAELVRDLLPVLDACDSALDLDVESPVGPIRAALLSELEKHGLVLIAPGGSDAFDPEHHDAVQHQPFDPDDGAEPEGPVIAELLRAGYAWKGRVIRPAMVSVMG